jgi:hypothetical protein
MVGKNNIEPNCFYSLNEKGKPVKVF